MVVIDLLNVICASSPKMSNEQDKSCGAESFEYTGPEVAIRLGIDADNDSLNLVTGRARHPVMHFMHMCSVSGYTASSYSESGKEEIALTENEVECLQINASEKVTNASEHFKDIYKGCAENTSQQPGNTLLDILALTAPNFFEDFGSQTEGQLVVIHLMNKVSDSDDLIDEDGVKLSSMNPILYHLFNCTVIKVVRGYTYPHIWIEEPDFKN